MRRRWLCALVTLALIVSPAAAEAAAPKTTAGPSLGVAPTAVSFSSWSTRVAYGYRASFRGFVYVNAQHPQGYARVALHDATVHLYARPAGSSRYRRVDSAQSTLDEGFRLVHRPSRNTTYRVVYYGNLVFKSAAASRQVGVYRRVTGRASGSIGGPYTVSGSVRPRAAYKRIWLQRRSCTSCKWSYYRLTRTSSRSTFSFRYIRTGYYRIVLPADSHYVSSSTKPFQLR